ncbi:MAG: phosphatidylserine/phosphatidylglycerophosphate/cardiolipin synthase family protein [Kiritimatiellae bacterium]|nr:phosphatidylserine/phosphatidylglycerophosphate/cardiolipin synthase family protein [Kiritimatiellia bacterium]
MNPAHTAFVLFLLAVNTALAAPDLIYLRDGRMLEGQVMNELRDQYSFRASAGIPASQQIPKDAVKFVVYGDPAKARQVLGLDQAARLGKNTDLATATILPTEAFGQSLGPVVQAATQSIWITAYYVSGFIEGPIKVFYETIRAKARAGLDVVMICEFSAGTRPAVRNATLNFVKELSRDGVTVLFIQGGKTMHKKMIIVDGKTVLLGSSNLTVAGTVGSNEMNVQVDSPTFAKRAASDFARLRARAIPATELK